MAIGISEKARKMIENPSSLKVLATVGPDGKPHVVCKGSLSVNSDGQLEYLELIESSQTGKNMVYSIWNNKTVAINVTDESRSIQIKGIPVRALISGKRFEESYRHAKESLGVDLSTVWLIEPIEEINENFEERRKTEESLHPILKHLDQITV